MIDRRAFLGTLVLAVAAAPLRSAAQAPAKVVRLGVLVFGARPADSNLPRLLEALRDLGYAEGRNLAIEYRYAQGKPERLPELAADLVRLKPDVIFAAGGDVARYAKEATRTIPIVVATSDDPVESGLVASFARPGGNITGLTFLISDLAGKRLEMFREIVPKVTKVALLHNPDHPDPELRETQAAARAFGVQIVVLEARRPGEIDAMLQALSGQRAEALIVVSSRLTAVHQQNIVRFAEDNRLPLITGWGPWAEGGALLAYGPNTGEIVRRAALYIDKIVKGAWPGDLPVERPTKFELVINVRTAERLGLTVPPSLLLRADRVIQ
ncbi:MAG: ABC transporter substrate-binding protein [Candidatus Rokuibacteriota bacterium]